MAWPALDSACLLACWPSFSRQRERENPEGKGKGEGKDESGNLPPFPAQAPCPKGERKRLAWPALASACLLACWPSFSRIREGENPKVKEKGEGKGASDNLPLLCSGPLPQKGKGSEWPSP